MTTKIVVAGATGNLGGRIVKALLARGAAVTALVRAETPADKLGHLGGATIAHFGDAGAFAGAACVVSAMQGLRDVIVELQTKLVDAAVDGGVPRFIPSDYSIDFTKVPAGLNRNLDLRREFHERLDRTQIAATSILNGAFSNILTRPGVLFDVGKRTVTYWDNADQVMDFTTLDNTAAFTAAAALDPKTPRILRIAGAQVSARDLASLVGFELVRAGSLADLAAAIARMREAKPDPDNIFPPWQGMQYMHNMFDGRAKLEPIDNARYPDIVWTGAREMLDLK